MLNTIFLFSLKPEHESAIGIHLGDGRKVQKGGDI